MFVLQKGGEHMNDYMRALRQRFYTPPGCEDLNAEWEAAHGALHECLNRDERKLLLRLIDVENKLRDEASLHSFISGYRLACGVHRELTEQPPYSFDKEEEQKAEELYIREQEET